MPDHDLGRFGIVIPSRRTIVAGVALGVALLTAVTIAGVFGPGHTVATPLPAPSGAEIHSGTQPELEAALVPPAELPTRYVAVESPKPTRRSMRKAEGCSALLGDRDDLLRAAGSTARPVPQRSAQTVSTMPGSTDTLLSQVLTTFAGTGATDAFNDLRRFGKSCRDFGARLEDGTEVRVRVEELTAAATPPALLKASGDTYTLRLTLTGGRRVMTGYLSLGRAGRVLSMLRQMTPAETADQRGFLGLLDQAARRLIPLTAPR
jgi:hypothetical protein